MPPGESHRRGVDRDGDRFFDGSDPCALVAGDLDGCVSGAADTDTVTDADSDTDTDEPVEKGGRGCASYSGAAPWLTLLLTLGLTLIARRRR